MGKKRVMVPADEVDLSEVEYKPEVIQAPHMAGLSLKLFVKLIESPWIGSLIISYLKKQNKMTGILRNTVIPEAPMYKPEFPPLEPEPGVVGLEEDGKPEDRVELALKCLPHYDAATSNPSMVAECIISAMEEISNKEPPTPLLISFDAEEVRKQAAASTQRKCAGNPLSILDGIFMAIKDDIDCYPHPSKGATTWFHEVRPVKKDAVCVSRLRRCGVIFLLERQICMNWAWEQLEIIQTTELDELTNNAWSHHSPMCNGGCMAESAAECMCTGASNMNRSFHVTLLSCNYRTTRNPHAYERYTGGSSSGPAAIVASGLCSAALGNRRWRFNSHSFFSLWCSGLENNIWTY
ncbi:fatty acid amide hydrolase [Actinidia rufa]|uniref:Fatty acid amide hydrolase n=1 Tax=Actinidia rufa TaxID=165716 RepID=A0A7J0DFX4_9ERIC|nr:fatty acid amide hydrolase [Actinidia rufa]